MSNNTNTARGYHNTHTYTTNTDTRADARADTRTDARPDARADALAPALDAAACAAFGPLTLSLLTVRFLRRLELLDEVASSRLQSYMLKAATPCARGCSPTSAPTGHMCTAPCVSRVCR